MHDTNVLTLDEVAELLRTDPATVGQLLDDGAIAGFKVAGEWRILAVAVVDFLRREMAATQQAILARQLTDPHTWARELARSPELADLVKGREFEDGTMGAFLKEALRTGEQEHAADNILPFKPSRD